MDHIVRHQRLIPAITETLAADRVPCSSQIGFTRPLRGLHTKRSTLCHHLEGRSERNLCPPIFHQLSFSPSHLFISYGMHLFLSPSLLSSWAILMKVLGASVVPAARNSVAGEAHAEGGCRSREGHVVESGASHSLVKSESLPACQAIPVSVIVLLPMFSSQEWEGHFNNIDLLRIWCHFNRWRLLSMYTKHLSLYVSSEKKDYCWREIVREPR